MEIALILPRRIIVLKLLQIFLGEIDLIMKTTSDGLSAEKNY